MLVALAGRVGDARHVRMAAAQQSRRNQGSRCVACVMLASEVTSRKICRPTTSEGRWQDGRNCVVDRAKVRCRNVQ